MSLLSEPPVERYTVRAPAKINLHLGVGAPREDGFHPLATVYHAIGLYDDVSASTASEWALEVFTADYLDPDAVPRDGNIVELAARALARHHDLGDDVLPALVSIDKTVPVAGGMGGGSADAAAALVALDRLWATHTTDEDLLALAAALGSDVPFALLGGTALGTGRGELVEPVPDQGTWWWVAVPSLQGLSTPDVYRHYDKLFPDAPAEPSGPEAVLAALETGDPRVLARALHNDLQLAACDLRPDLSRLIETGEELGALRGMVSGSGPTVMFLAQNGDSARHLGEELRGCGYPVALAAPGPVAGSTLVSF